MSSRRRYNDSELDQLQKYKIENRKLKQQISQLRKQISRIDVDRFQNLKDLLDAQDRREAEDAAKSRGMESDKRWECWTCRTGILRVHVIEKPTGSIYNRVCDNEHCGHRTKFQKLDRKKD